MRNIHVLVLFTILKCEKKSTIELFWGKSGLPTNATKFYFIIL